MENKRLVGIDVFRVISALMIFFFHTRTGMEFYYGRIQLFFRMGAIFMTAFFMLSGFCLYTSNQNRSLMKLSETGLFYAKRFASVMPLYYVVTLLYMIFFGKESLIENIVLAPMELLGLQATMSSMFELSLNNGTWFISCLVISYLLYPFIQELVKQMSLKGKLILMCLAGFIVMWVAIVIWKFKLEEIYTNPFYRGLEFFIGVLLASSKEELEKMKFFRFFMQWKIFVLEFLVLIVCVDTAVRKDFAVGNFMTYDLFCLPIFVMMIFSLSGVKSNRLEHSKLLGYLSSFSYAFFMAQIFTWEIAWQVIHYFNLKNNLGRISLTFSICVIIALILHEGVEKPLKKLCMVMYHKYIARKQA